MKVHPKKRMWTWLLLLGGVSVPLSYVHGLVTHPDAREGLWGGIPEALRPLYSGSMILAAAGFFLFTGFTLFRVDPEERNARFTVFPLLYALILIPYALWLPLTFAVMEHPSTLLWWAVRVDLLLVGLGSIGLFPALFAFRPGKRDLPFALALLGLTFFCLQTVVLDVRSLKKYSRRVQQSLVRANQVGLLHAVS